MTQLNQDAMRARDMIGEAKTLWDDPARCGEAIKLKRDGEALRDQVIDKAVSAADAGAPDGDSIRQGYVKVASDEQRRAAAFAAEVARERAMTRIEELGDHLRVSQIFNEEPDRAIVTAPAADLNLAIGAIDSARYGDDGQPIFAPMQHMTAIEIFTLQAELSRNLGHYGAVGVSLQDRAVVSDTLADLASAREAVKLVRTQREAIKNAPGTPPEVIERLDSLEHVSAVLGVESANAVSVIASGMVAAMADPQQVATLPIDAGARAALVNVSESVRRSLGATDGASFRAKAGSDWSGFIWRFVDAQLGQIDQSDPQVKEAIEDARRNVAGVMQLVAGKPAD